MSTITSIPAPPIGAHAIIIDSSDTETVDEVRARVFKHVRRVASGEVPALAEEHKHREFQFRTEQTVSL